MRRLPIIAAVLLLAGSPAVAETQYRFEGVGRIVVFADVHGAYAEFVSTLREARVIDESLHWSGRETHLVGLGDLLDRGPESRRAMELLMRLETEASQAGGAVHVLLGNHEIMNMVGDLRYVSAEEFAAFAGDEDAALREENWLRVIAGNPAASRADFDAAYPGGYFAQRASFSPTGRYGRWLHEKPFLIVINDTAFVHAGLPPMVARLGLEATNDALRSQLDGYLSAWRGIESELALAPPAGFLDQPARADAAGDGDSAKKLDALQHQELFTPAGPIWYRGQALCYAHAEAENLETALARLDVKRVVEGHTVSSTGRAVSRFDGRVTLLDTGMLENIYHGEPAALIFENGAWSVAYADRPGERFQPEPPPRAVGPRPRGLDDDALEHWLAEAEVVSVEEIDAGITQPQRVTLRKDGVELRAVFKRLSTDFGISDRTRALNEADRFEYELAAYKLDRLIGLDMVPVTVFRTIGKQRGILQFWIDGSVNLRRMLEQKLQPEGWCDTAPQYNLMNVFDALIHNTDRTQENALFTKDWMLVLIDHTRAFAVRKDFPTLLYKGEFRVPPSLAGRLAALDAETLQAQLGPYLHRKQIDALLKRRDRLLSQDGISAGNRQAVTP